MIAANGPVEGLRGCRCFGIYNNLQSRGVGRDRAGHRSRLLPIGLDVAEAVNCVAPTKAVANAAPFHRTVEPFKKPDPFTVRVKPDPPAVAELGFRLTITGGFVMKLAAFDLAPPGFTTVT